MTELDRIHVINKAALSGANYFVSLLNQGRQCSLLSDSDTEQIQAECLRLLAEQTEKWNRGRSSSVRVEKAQELLSSILYTIGLALKAYSSPEDAVDALKQEPMEQLFQTGQKGIRRKIQTARLTHRQITKKLFQTKNVFYRATVADGISGFFKLYSPEFSAQEIHITADYPTFLDVADLAGIEFIERYLRNIAYENQFLLYFSANKVHHLLSGLDENYQQILMNIYEPVLAAALGCVLTGLPVCNLSCDLDVLKVLFHEKSAEEIRILLSTALNQIVAEFDCPHGLTNYLKSSLPKLALSIQNAMRLGHLETVILTPFFSEAKPQIILSYGDRMDDREYTKLLDELMWCESVEKKTEIILRKIHFLGDLLDILRDFEPTQRELVSMLRHFPLEIIAILLRQYPNGDFLTDDREIVLYSALQELCAAFTETTRAQMEIVVEALQFNP
ncbi:MAG: DUF6179 domain-containing protein [Lachnospiraceae bacterium]|nr:DUF6179 domain-containing protein [Lachnospiraceae bacterium]